MNWDRIANIGTLVTGALGVFFTILAFFFGQYRERKKNATRIPLEFMVEVHRFLPDYDIAKNKLVKDKRPQIHEIIFNEDKETRVPNCVLSPISALAQLHENRDYSYIFICNNAEHSILLHSFNGPERRKFLVNVDLLAKEAILMALPSYGAPPELILNYNGTYLQYSIKVGTGPIRPNVLNDKV